jgi:site-specific DNA recombinase
MIAAIYARVSTDEQALKYGIGSQIHELRALAARQGYTVAAELTDEGYSGTDLERPALAQLRDLVRQRSVDVVLVHDPDRLSRRLPHQLILVSEMDHAGVRVEFVTTPREMTPEGQLLLNIKGVISEYEREKIVERTVRGKREKARRGLVVASYPYGYRPDPARPGQLVVHEGEASVIQMMYAWLIEEGRSGRSIVTELRRLGVPPARGGRWGLTQVRRILSSDRYTGRTFYNVRRTARGQRTVERPASEWIAVPIPAIVTPERHAAALAALDRNRQALVGRPARFVYLLRGLLRCTACARRYDGIPSHGYRYYRCRGRDLHTTSTPCRSPWLAAAWAEAAVWDAVAGLLRRPEVLRHAAEQYATSRGVRDVELRSRVEHLKRQLQAIERREQRLLDLYVDEQIDKREIAGRLRSLAQERQRLTEELGRVESQATAHGALGGHLDAVERWCGQARRGLQRLTPEGRRQLLGDLVDEIRVGADRELEVRGILPIPPSRILDRRM